MAKKEQEAKPKTHPELFNVVYVDVSTGREFKTKSTMKSKETVVIDGVSYYKILRDTTSDSHPAYTGKKRFIDSAGRITVFENKFKRKRS